jgi:hypothetical protein
MTNEEVTKEIKELAAKTEGMLNVLRRSPVILTFNKLLGLQQKTAALLAKLENEGKPSQGEDTSK